MISKKRICTAFLCAVLCLLLLCGCRENQVLPTGGYDYCPPAASGAVLGYPIPRTGDNPMYCSLPLTAQTMPAAFVYDSTAAEYSLQDVLCADLSLPGECISAPYVITGNERTYFAAASEISTVSQGNIDSMAVVLSDGTLYLADETAVIPIAKQVLQVWDVHRDGNRLLFADTDGMLYEYRHTPSSGDISVLWDTTRVHDAWYAYGTDAHTVVWKHTPTDPLSSAFGFRFSEDGGESSPAQLPETDETPNTSVFVRGTVCFFRGNDDSAYFYDIRTGEAVDMDMGGLYRFPQNTDTVTMPLSPDGLFVYFYDIDYIYRLNLRTGDLDLTYNEAPIFEGDCILSSMTAVTDEIVLLSQASNEYTEHVPTITIAYFEENIPEVRHEHERIDMDYHPWETDY